jgi:hypothetical protein
MSLLLNVFSCESAAGLFIITPIGQQLRRAPGLLHAQQYIQCSLCIFYVIRRIIVRLKAHKMEPAISQRYSKAYYLYFCYSFSAAWAVFRALAFLANLAQQAAKEQIRFRKQPSCSMFGF